mmetsp:Transcript_60578/g.136946  ORF Transcript_60578/g.136946 Transcript_60578/m.136946 type:complete len:373 (-) Transcript_60578:284-1402(-)
MAEPITKRAKIDAAATRDPNNGQSLKALEVDPSNCDGSSSAGTGCNSTNIENFSEDSRPQSQDDPLNPPQSQSLLPAPANGKQYSADEAASILVKSKKCRPLISEMIEKKLVPCQTSNLYSIVEKKRKGEEIRPWGKLGRSKIDPNAPRPPKPAVPRKKPTRSKKTIEADLRKFTVPGPANGHQYTALEVADILQEAGKTRMRSVIAAMMERNLVPCKMSRLYQIRQFKCQGKEIKPWGSYGRTRLATVDEIRDIVAQSTAGTGPDGQASGEVDKGAVQERLLELHKTKQARVGKTINSDEGVPKGMSKGAKVCKRTVERYLRYAEPDEVKTSNAAQAEARAKAEAEEATALAQACRSCPSDRQGHESQVRS